MAGNPWDQVLQQIAYYLREGPNSSALTALVPAANFFTYDSDHLDAMPPVSSSQPVLVIDQGGGQIDPTYSSNRILVCEEYELAVWSDSLNLSRLNALRHAVLAALMAGYPTLGLDFVASVSLRSTRVTLSLDKVEHDADGRLMQWRNDLRKNRQRAALLGLTVRFWIDTDALLQS